MFHYRWARDVDQISSAGRIARMRGPKASEQEHDSVRRPGARPHGGPGLVRRLQRSDRAADRGRLSRDAGLLDAHLAKPALSVRRTAGLRRFRPLGAVLRNVDRSDRRRPDRRRRAACARLGAPHAVAEGRRRIRNLDRAGADPDADPDQTGWTTILAVDARQREGARGRQGRIQRHARRQGLDPEAAKISRALARHAAREICRGRRQGASSIWFWRPRVALPDCAPRYQFPRHQGERPWKRRNTRSP